MSDCLKDLHIRGVGVGRGKIINKKIPLKSENHEFEEGEIQWDKDELKLKSEVNKVQKVKVKVFYDLVLEWYGVKLPYLNTTDEIEFKAAAEQEDPRKDHDPHDDFKVLVTDGKEPESEIGLDDTLPDSIFVQYHPELIGAMS